MGISTVSTNLKTSLMHACKAGVIHSLMCPQRLWLQRHSRCVAQRRETSTRQAFCFPSAKSSGLTPSWLWRKLLLACCRTQKSREYNLVVVVCILRSAVTRRCFQGKRITTSIIVSCGKKRLNFGICYFGSSFPLSQGLIFKILACCAVHTL